MHISFYICAPRKAEQEDREHLLEGDRWQIQGHRPDLVRLATGWGPRVGTCCLLDDSGLFRCHFLQLDPFPMSCDGALPSTHSSHSKGG